MVPDCEKCGEVELFESNKEICEMYILVRGQVLLNPSGDIYGLNHAAVWADLKLYKVENELQMFEDILSCYKIEQEINASKKGK